MSVRSARSAVWVAAFVLAVLHNDFWQWDDHSLWFGFLPIGLGYQVLISLSAGLLWAVAVRFAWPEELEAWGSEDVGADGKSS